MADILHTSGARHDDVRRSIISLNPLIGLGFIAAMSAGAWLLAAVLFL